MTLPITPSFRLDGRRAIVTGAGRGIGFAAAAALGEAGAEVTLIARTASEIKAAAAEIGNGATAAVLDVSDITAVKAFFAEHLAFHILINNAGTNRPSMLVDMQDADLDAVVDLNIKAALYVSRAVVRSLLANPDEPNKPASIINVSSQMGHVGGPKRAVYCATKHAMEGMTKALAWELGRQRIRVNTICPTYIETPMTAPMLADPAFREFAENGTALGRVGQLEEVMGAIVFLASDASSLVTGSALMLDGGWTAR